MFWVLVVMAANAAYVAALPSATVFYVANVLLHIVLGAAGVGWLLWKWRRSARALPLAAAALAGLYLIFAGATFDHRAVLWAHILLATAGLAILMPRWSAPLAVTFALALSLRFGRPPERIRNPQTVPVSMAEEGEGPRSPFWPSSSRTNTGGLIPSDFFMDSKRCGECHKDIYEEWKSSMHHFASFNNPFYRATILDMQEKSGTRGSKWCAGCHDHAVFFNGRFERPIREQVETPEAQNGLGCVSCHSIAHVYSTMGNGDFEIAYPPLHRLASSDNPLLHRVDAFLTYLNPEPHRRTFLKALHAGRHVRILRGVPQGAPGPARESLPLAARLQRVRQLAGERRFRPGRALVLLSGQTLRLRRLPHAAARFARPRQPLRQGAFAPLRRGQYRGGIRSITTTRRCSATEAFLKSGFITVDLFAASPVDDRQAGTRR